MDKSSEIKDLKIRKTVEVFLHNPEASMIELADLTGFSKSSCQRYLNDPRIHYLFNQDICDFITRQLATNKLNAQIQGGINSFNNNAATKSENGEFTGSVHSKADREFNKQKDILEILNSYLECFSIDKVSDKLKFTRDYVYDCLTDKRIISLFGQEKFNAIQEILKNNLPDNFKNNNPKK